MTYRTQASTGGERQARRLLVAVRNVASFASDVGWRVSPGRVADMREAVAIVRARFPASAEVLSMCDATDSALEAVPVCIL